MLVIFNEFNVSWFRKSQHDKQPSLIDSYFAWHFIYIKNVTKEKNMNARWSWNSILNYEFYNNNSSSMDE